jgi:hypothetical protein
VILFSGWYSRALCQAHPEKTFVFGDNLLGFGKGGQAIIRDEPNAHGVPTKRKPSMALGSFFEENSENDLDAVLASLKPLWTRLENGLAVIFPVNDAGEISLGLERAELRQRAPSIYETICRHVEEMCAAHGGERLNGLPSAD